LRAGLAGLPFLEGNSGKRREPAPGFKFNRLTVFLLRNRVPQFRIGVRMISVANLTKMFGDKAAVKNLTFEVKGGEILGLLGPNAAGKTTTMRILTGFFPPTAGSASIAGLDVVEQALEVRKLVGYLPEHVPLYVEMTPREFLTFAASAKKVPKSNRKAAVDRALERCNLGNVADQLIATLSRGYRQRVGLGQAIINDPKVLILDEPTVGLDPSQVRDIRALLREIGRDATVILSSHILSEVSALCSRVIIIAGGEIKAMDTPANLTAAMESEARFVLRISGAEPSQLEPALAAVEGVSRVSHLDGGRFEVASTMVKPDDLGPRLAAAVVGGGWSLHELQPQAAGLEEIFISLVKPGDEAQS
jgi:ABC-2 type transport system ATP-binding protein